METATRIDVWQNQDDHDWCISTCEDDGEEIKCLAYGPDKEEVWDNAEKHSDKLRLPAYLLDNAGQVLRTYEPDYGDLYDYETNEILRKATNHERIESVTTSSFDGGAGVIKVDDRSCYVK